MITYVDINHHITFIQKIIEEVFYFFLETLHSHLFIFRIFVYSKSFNQNSSVFSTLPIQTLKKTSHSHANFNREKQTQTSFLAPLWKICKIYARKLSYFFRLFT